VSALKKPDAQPIISVNSTTTAPANAP